MDAGKEPDGESAKSGPGAKILSGLGGLGVEGIVGNDESVGEGAIPLGVGNKGSISGGKLGEEARGALGKNAGAADIVEYFTCTLDEDKAEEKKAMKTMNNIPQGEQREAIK